MDRVLLFDIDGTLTPPRKRLQPEMAEALQRLTVPFHVAAGSDLPLVHPQFLEPLWELGFRGTFDAFLSNGSAHYRCRYEDAPSIVKLDEFNFRQHFGDEDYARCLRVVRNVLEDHAFRLPEPLRVIGERLIDRGSMLNVAPIGRPRGDLSDEARRNREAFARFDRETGYRRRMLGIFRELLSEIRREKRLLIMLGGETSFDFVIDGMDKTNAVRTLMGYGIEKITFVGDALFEGGNDSVISDFIASWNGDRDCPLEAIQVQGWEETIRVFHQRNWIS